MQSQIREENLASLPMKIQWLLIAHLKTSANLSKFAEGEHSDWHLWKEWSVLIFSFEVNISILLTLTLTLNASQKISSKIKALDNI